MQVFDADLGVFTGDGCHGGGNGYNRALCIEQSVIVSGCSWYGRAKSCSQTCPPNQILLSQNTHIGHEASGCDHNRFSSYCCQSIISNAVSTCPATNAGNALSGGLAPRVADTAALSGSTIGPDLEMGFGTKIECSVAAYGVGSVLVGTGTVVAGLYIWNKMPGYWQQSIFGEYIWQPIRDTLFPSVTSAPNPSCSVTVTVTLSTSTATSTITRSCDGSRYPQACAHYSSIIRDRAAFNLAILTCPMSPNPAPRGAVASTYDKQHKQPWLSWVPQFTKVKQPNVYDSCQRDEYPAFIFAANGQWVRYLPAAQNRGAGQYFNRVCNSNPPAHNGPAQGGPTLFSTCTIEIPRTYSVNAFSFSFINMPNQADDGIPVNPCLPSITADAGFALFTDDAWYGAAPHINPKKSDYASAIPAALTANKVAPRPVGPYKRDIFLPAPSPEDSVFQDPDRLFIDEGNSSRKASDDELWEHLGLIRCQDKECSHEKEVLGHGEQELQSKEIPITATSAPAVSRIASASQTSPVTGGSPWTPVAQATQLPEHSRKRNHLHRHRDSHHHRG